MDAHLIDSAVYGHAWSTPESTAIFAERARLARWLEVLKALAAAQADLGIIPVTSAQAISGLDARHLDLAALGAETQRTSHSTIGLVRALQAQLPEAAREHVYHGATVQDVSDTAAVLELKAVGRVVWRDLRAVESALLDLAVRHRDTPMLGRTHGQPGAPVTFGFKAACWADETARQLERWRQSGPRLLVGQLAGAVGVLAFHGDLGLALRHRFCLRLGLGEATVSWLTARDRIAEFACNAALVSATSARIANEVYNLQRREIGEVTEPASEAAMGSITMPHKRNPERSEQIVTLARLVRSGAGVLTETMVGDHERDARTWKTEWVLLPEISHYLLAQLHLVRDLTAGIEVDAAAMAANLSRMGDFGSQELLRRMSSRLGKHRANDELQQVYRRARQSGCPLEALIKEVATPAETAGLNQPATGSAAAMVDAVVAASAQRRASETDDWPGGDGCSGEDGSLGVDGSLGEDKSPGEDGSLGVDGSLGEDKSPGEDGSLGVDGSLGEDKSPGEDGSLGVDGSLGEDKSPGEDGQPGEDGSLGVDGSPGEDGRPGAAGFGYEAGSST